MKKGCLSAFIAMIAIIVIAVIITDLSEKGVKSSNATEVKKNDSIVKANIEKIKADNLTLQKKILPLLRIEKDKFRGITWYYDKTSPKTANAKAFYLYIGEDGDNNVWMKLKIQYASSDWLFFHSCIILADNERFVITPDKVETDNNSTIWEWADVNVNKEIYHIISKIVDAKDVELRYVGRQYHDDKKITIQERKALKNMIEFYQAKGGQINY